MSRIYIFGGLTMGHSIQCFLGRSEVIQEIVSPLGSIKHTIIELPQGMHGLFLGENLYDAIHKHTDTDNNYEIEPFDLFDLAMKNYLEAIKPNGRLIYIETEYFGGEGTQVSGIFKDGQLLEVLDEKNIEIDEALPFPDRFFNLPINTALRYLGVKRDSGYDEFDTLRLGNFGSVLDDGV
jgi:hypothetical protein